MGNLKARITAVEKALHVQANYYSTTDYMSFNYYTGNNKSLNLRDLQTLMDNGLPLIQIVGDNFICQILEK